MAATCGLLVFVCLMSPFAGNPTSRPATNALDGVYLSPNAEFSVAVDSKGLWPKLLLLPGGEILATFYNHPSHGFGCGDIEAFASSDDGRSWQFRGQVSDHADRPEHCRMNHAFGRTAKGDLIVLASGWSKGRELPLLPVQVCISSDQGRTWKRHLLPVDHIPYGRVVLSPDGRLTAAMFELDKDRRTCHLYESRDQGQTWTRSGCVGKEEHSSETALLRCRDGKWLAAARSARHGCLFLYTSADEGRTWSAGRKAPLPGYPGDLLQLTDGRVLLLAEQRDARSGITACLSGDQGETWSPYWTFISVPWGSDHGYPSAAQLADGTVLVAYYWGGRAGEGQYGGRDDLPDNRGLPWHPRYHMGLIRWRPERFGGQR